MQRSRKVCQGRGIFLVLKSLFHQGISPLSLTQQGSPQSSSQQENKSQQRAIKEEILNCVALKQIEC